MSDHFERDIRIARAMKVSNVPRVKRVRLYSEQRGQLWALQVRAPMALRNYSEGKDFIVAHASLKVEDLIALRDAINAQLKTVAGASDA